MLDATTTCIAVGSGTQCATIYAERTSTDPSYVNGFTYGEIVISTMLFLNLAVLMVLTYHVLFRRIKIKNQ